MLFNSWQFFLFFPLVTAGYFALPAGWRWAWLLVASCAFYMAFVPAYILILAATIGVDYVAALLIERSEGARRKAWLMASLAVNLGALGFFKYFNFFNDNVHALATLLHWNYPIAALSIVLPIGLSFHIFQSLSYTIEVYRGHQKPERHLGIYALYVMFYPQLVAGPIERPQNLLHQFHAPKPFDAQGVASGLRRMLWGLFKKVVIADRLAQLIGPVFDHPSEYSGLTLALAAVLFSFQIYCDFSGYSDIAVGAARVMGVDLMENFRQPYFSASVREFWTRWHISLSTWFKDYLYFPLGGNRVSKARWSLNLFIVFLVSGLWHGANWTFVVWGALHGLYMVASIWTADLRRTLSAWTRLERWPLLLHAARVGTTFALVTFAWIFFRAPSLDVAWTFVTRLVGGFGELAAGPRAIAQAVLALHASRAELTLIVLVVGLLLLVSGIQSRGAGDWLARQPRPLRWALYQAMVLALLVFGIYDSHAFIYFQF